MTYVEACNLREELKAEGKYNDIYVDLDEDTGIHFVNAALVGEKNRIIEEVKYINFDRKFPIFL